MRAAPPFQITVRHFGQWRVAALLLASAASGSALAWAFLAYDRMPWAAIAAGGFGVLAALWVLVPAFRLRDTSLRWDGQVWHWGPAAARGFEPASGGLTLACDLGSWMLVCLTETLPPPGLRMRARCWLPIQRAGHELHWHALRCTVYSPRLLPPTHLPPRQDPSPE